MQPREHDQSTDTPVTSERREHQSGHGDVPQLWRRDRPRHHSASTSAMHPLDTHLRTLPELRFAECSDAGDSARTAADKAASAWWRVFEAQATSRHLDFVARELQQQGQGFYTIGSAGHESNALVATALRPTDPALLHYRSGAFYVARAQQVPGSTPVRDVLQGLMALADEPIAGGRHKVFGHPDLGDHPADVDDRLAPAAGGRAGRRPAPRPPAAEWTASGRRMRSSSARSATPRPTTRRRSARSTPRSTPPSAACRCRSCSSARTTVWGISVPTPPGWIESAYGSRPGLDYLVADGSDPVGGPIGDHRGGAPRPRANVGRSSCTCGPYGSSAMPAAMPRSAIARRARSKPTTPGIPCWPRLVELRAAGASPEQIRARYDADPRGDRYRGRRAA